MVRPMPRACGPADASRVSKVVFVKPSGIICCKVSQWRSFERIVLLGLSSCVA